MKKMRSKWILRAFLINLLIAAAIFVPAIIAGGGLLTMGDDFDAQELAFNMLANREIKAGNIFFNWSIDIGSDFISSLSFYNLGSPFFWISFLFPPKVFPYLIGWIYILKYAVCGMMAMLWLERELTEKRIALLGSVLYAFSGFQATNLVFYHFHDAVALFPLLLLGLDLFLQENRRGLFSLAVGINALVNWNFFVGEVIFLFIYYLVRYTPISRLLKKEKVLAEIGGLFLFGCLGAGIAAVIIVPTLQSMLGFSRISDKISIKNGLIFNGLELYRNLRGLMLPADAMNNQSVIGQMNWYSVSAYLPLFGVAPALAWIIASFRKKDYIARILVICFAIACVPVLNSVFVLFNWEPYRRWYYMPILFLSLASCRTLELVFQDNKRMKKIFFSSLITTAGVMVIVWLRLKLLWKIKAFRWEGTPEHIILNPTNWKIVLVTGIMGIVLVAVAFVFIKDMDKRYISLLVMTGLFAFLTTRFTLYEYKEVAYYSPSEVYNEIVRTGEGLRADVLPYRYAMVDDYYNRDMAHSLTSMDSFISVVDDGIFQFYDAIDVPRHVLTLNGPEGTERLLSARYFVSKDPNWKGSRGKTLLKENDIKSAVYRVYEDPEALPVGFAYDTYVTRSEFDAVESSERAMAMLHTLVVADEDEDYVKNILDHDDLGEVKFSEAVMLEDSEKRRAEGVKNFVHSSTYFGGDIETAGPRFVFFSVPYSSRWSAAVNGEDCRILNINGLMAVPVSAGTSRIDFHYNIRWHIAAMIISVLSIVITVVVIVKRREISGGFGKHHLST